MLRQLDTDLWVSERPLRFGGVELGARMTVVRLSDGGLFLHSPLAPDADLRGALQRLGPPRFAVAPNRFHHLYIGAYRDAFPAVQLFAAPGLPEKRTDLRFDGVLDSDQPPPGWAGQIDQAFVRGYPLMNEVAFCHRASRTLLTCDLVFNIGADAPLMTRVAFQLLGGYGRCGPTWVERFFVRDRAAARAALETILSWDFDRVVLAHGHILERGGKAMLREGYGWLLTRDA
jgi:hypothetical protein